MKLEFEEWIKTAKILVFALTGQELQEEIVVEKKSETPSSAGRELLSRQDTKLSTQSTGLDEKEKIAAEKLSEKEPSSNSLIDLQKQEDEGLVKVIEEEEAKGIPSSSSLQPEVKSQDAKGNEPTISELERVVEGQQEETENEEKLEEITAKEENIQEIKDMVDGENNEDKAEESSEKIEKKEDKEEIEAIGFDETTRPKSLQGTRDERGLRKPETEQSEKAYDTLQTIEKLQEDLM